jgi:hypothetical protein
MKAFVKSVLAGAIAGAALPMILTVMLALDGLVRGDPPLSMLLLGLLPLLMTIPVALAGALAIGLPLSALLKWAHRESRAAYVSAGAAAGFLLPLFLGILNDVSNAFLSFLPADTALKAWWIGSFFGALSGAVTGNVWWRSRFGPKLP